MTEDLWQKVWKHHRTEFFVACAVPACFLLLCCACCCKWCKRTKEEHRDSLACVAYPHRGSLQLVSVNKNKAKPTATYTVSYATMRKSYRYSEDPETTSDDETNGEADVEHGSGGEWQSDGQRQRATERVSSGQLSARAQHFGVRNSVRVAPRLSAMLTRSNEVSEGLLSEGLLSGATSQSEGDKPQYIRTSAPDIRSPRNCPNCNQVNEVRSISSESNPQIDVVCWQCETEFRISNPRVETGVSYSVDL